MLPEGAEPSAEETPRFPTWPSLQPSSRTEPVLGRQLHMLVCSGPESFLFIRKLGRLWQPSDFPGVQLVLSQCSVLLEPSL